MTRLDPLDTLRRRAFRHTFEDGAVDLVVAVRTLIVGVATQRRIFLALSVVYLATMRLAWKAVHDWIASRRTFAVLSLGISMFFWLFPFGPRINPSDRLTLSLFVIAALLFAVGTVTMVRFVRLRPVVSAEHGDAR